MPQILSYLPILTLHARWRNTHFLEQVIVLIFCYCSHLFLGLIHAPKSTKEERFHGFNVMLWKWFFNQVHKRGWRGTWRNRLEVHPRRCFQISSLSQVSGSFIMALILCSKIGWSLRIVVYWGTIAALTCFFSWMLQFVLCSDWEWNTTSGSRFLYFWLVVGGCILSLQPRRYQHSLSRHLRSDCRHFWLCVGSFVSPNGWWSMGTHHSLFITSSVPTSIFSNAGHSFILFSRPQSIFWNTFKVSWMC